jgi:hypothetical protein
VSISVTPASAVLKVADTQQFVATAMYSDSTTSLVTTTASWTSGAAGARIGLHTGLATGVTANSTPVVITATFGGKTATAAVTVTNASLMSIAVTPASGVIPVYGTQQFVATATYSDTTTASVTTTADWTSDSTGATVGPNTGMVAGVAASSVPVTITATLGGQTATAAVTVNGQSLTSIAVTPASAVIAVGNTQQFVATGMFAAPGPETFYPVTTTADWTADASGNATIGLNTGLATGVAASSVPVTITAAVGGKTSPAASLTVQTPPANPTAPVLGEAGRFVILAPEAITTTGVTAISNGDIGISPAARSLIAGFTLTQPAGDGHLDELTGSTWVGMDSMSYAADDANPAPFPYPLHYSTPVVGAPWTTTGAMLTQANTDLGIAATFLAADPNPGSATQVCPTELGNLTLTHGVYKTSANVTISTGTLTLDAQGDPDAVFIFNIGGTLTTGAPGGSIVLINGALAKNVYWRTAGITTIGAGTIFKGSVFATTKVVVNSGANITGSLYAVTDRVTLIADTITKAP